MREPKLIIPTTIPKFTAVDRNVFAHETKYTTEFLRRSSSFSSSLLFSLLLLHYHFPTVTCSRSSVSGNTNRSSIGKSCQNSKVRGMNSSVLYFSLRERRSGINSLNEAHRIGRDWKRGSLTTIKRICVEISSSLIRNAIRITQANPINNLLNTVRSLARLRKTR